MALAGAALSRNHNRGGLPRHHITRGQDHTHGYQDTPRVHLKDNQPPYPLGYSSQSKQISPWLHGKRDGNHRAQSDGQESSRR